MAICCSTCHACAFAPCSYLCPAPSHNLALPLPLPLPLPAHSHASVLHIWFWYMYVHSGFARLRALHAFHCQAILNTSGDCMNSLQSRRSITASHAALSLVHAAAQVNQQLLQSPSPSTFMSNQWCVSLCLNAGCCLQGLVCSIGVSNFSVKKLEAILSYAEIAPAVCQVWLAMHFKMPATNSILPLAFCKRDLCTCDASHICRLSMHNKHVHIASSVQLDTVVSSVQSNLQSPTDELPS